MFLSGARARKTQAKVRPRAKAEAKDQRRLRRPVENTVSRARACVTVADGTDLTFFSRKNLGLITARSIVGNGKRVRVTFASVGVQIPILSLRILERHGHRVLFGT